MGRNFPRCELAETPLNPSLVDAPGEMVCYYDKSISRDSLAQPKKSTGKTAAKLMVDFVNSRFS